MTTTEPANLPAVRMGNLTDKVTYAQHLASSALLPKQYQRQPANLLFAIEYAEMLQLPPMAAITGIHVIEGKPSASSALISALVRRAGHRLRVKGNDTEAVAQIIRADDPDWTFEVRWTLERAKQAGLTNKDVWKKYPAAMLKARAVSEVAREACEEALSGMHYTPEEMGAEVDEDGDPVIVEQVAQAEHRPGMTLREAAGGTQEAREAYAEENLAGAEATAYVADTEVVPEVGTITAAQTKKLAVQMNAAGITDRKDALDYVMSVIGRDVASRKELSKDEASRVIDALDQVIRTEAGATDTGTGEILDAELVDTNATADPAYDDAAWQAGGQA